MNPIISFSRKIKQCMTTVHAALKTKHEHIALHIKAIRFLPSNLNSFSFFYFACKIVRLRVKLSFMYRKKSVT